MKPRIPVPLFDRTEAMAAAVARRLRTARHLTILLDYDGTLTRIRRRPTQATLSGEVRETLRAVARVNGVRVAIISGRALADLRRRVGIPGLDMAGNHGLEILRAGRRWTHPGADARELVLRRIRRKVRLSLRSMPRVLVEDKRLAFTVHFRGLGAAQSREVRDRVGTVVREFGDYAEMVRGKKVVEIRPAVAWTKGDAVREIAGSGRHGLVIVLGDDRTDEDAFREVLTSGIGIRVGRRRKTYARYHVLGVAAVRRFLKAVIDARSPMQR
jgi:trehalose 6-phosphate phosphatase